MKGFLIALLLILGFILSPFSICVSDGWSMYPKLPPYNVNLVQEMDYDYPLDLLDYAPPEIKIGDTVLAYSPRSGRLITHDVVAINSMGYQLKGFNDYTNPVPDGYVKYDAIVGRVVEIPLINVPMFVNLSVFIVCFGFVAFLGFVTSATHDKYENEVKGKKKRLFEDMMIYLGFILFLSLIINSILIWRMIM